MQIQVSYNVDGTGHAVSVEIPDECPTCGRLVVFPFNGASVCCLHRRDAGIYEKYSFKLNRVSTRRKQLCLAAGLSESLRNGWRFGKGRSLDYFKVDEV